MHNGSLRNITHACHAPHPLTTMSLQVFHDPSPSFLVTTYYLDFPKLKNDLIKNSHFLLCPTTHSGAPNHSYSLVPRPSAKQAPSASPFIHSFALHQLVLSHHCRADSKSMNLVYQLQCMKCKETGHSVD